MGESEWEWETAEFGEEHAGRIGVLLADGSEPGPVCFDVGSGPEVHSRTLWSFYDGRHCRPRAAVLRAACACGWRGAAEYALDWQPIGDGELDEADVDLHGPLADWTAHLSVVRETTVALPEQLTALFTQLADRIQDATDDSPLVGLKAIAVLERLTGSIGQAAAEAVRDSGTPTEAVAEALGTTPSRALGILLRYRRS
ncbi:hypothetical protein LG634_36980 [Streptomyces bambusae]|uniref:hypothetical protein n=1 Tax=Streptomyces bambusae TaxID=1550616 RepID=UPI001CFFA605|nr:hypothetical protein [Streptomyces bambusae]MCB5170374.1 hypothetical protein [Streptomyces bambusae]